MTPWTISHQVPPFMEFSKNPGVGWHFLLQRIIPTRGPNSPLQCLCTASDFFLPEPSEKLTDLENKFVVTRGEAQGEREIGSSGLTCTSILLKINRDRDAKSLRTFTKDPIQLTSRLRIQTIVDLNAQPIL